jgi:hypothetical protein
MAMRPNRVSFVNPKRPNFRVAVNIADRFSYVLGRGSNPAQRGIEPLQAKTDLPYLCHSPAFGGIGSEKSLIEKKFHFINTVYSLALKSTEGNS